VTSQNDDRPIRALETRISLLEEEKQLLESALRNTSAELQRCVEERRQYLDSYLGVQQQNTTLMNLYVASRRLHASVDRDDVLMALQEIVINLVGSEELIILEQGSDAQLRPALSFGVAGERWRGAAKVVETCIATGEVVAGRPGDEITACIPMRIGEMVLGAIVIFGLLRQKEGLTDVDRELFELLANHAGIALYCSALHATESRRMGAQ